MNGKNRKTIATKLTSIPEAPLYDTKFPLIFFWSPKGGCTSLNKWFFFQIGLLQKAFEFSPWIHDYRAKVFQKQENYRLEIVEALVGDKKDVYKLVRNPFNRTVSSYLQTIRYKEIWDQVVPEGMQSGLSFKQFLYRIKNIGVRKDLIDNHIAQQYVEEEEVFIQNYVKLERFAAEIREIEKKYNLIKSPLDDIVKSHHHMAQKVTEKSMQTYAEIQMSREKLEGPLPEYKNFYDQETKDLVKELFKNDFIRYSYNQNDLD